jgi:hypothetical protein
MKNQYFGDNRDLFKYDLILHITKKAVVSNFTFIPMLTPNEPPRKSRKKHEGEQRNRLMAKAGYKNQGLLKFLNRFNNKSERNIRHLDAWFKKKGVKTVTLVDYFYHDERAKYFKEASKKLLHKSVICVDPDVGLEVKRTREKHILYAEVKDLYELMDNNSLLMIFQYIPRERPSC